MADFEKRAMIEEEDIYTFRQSSQISGQCGLIGYLRGDFGSTGDEFFSSWFDYRGDLKTPEFKEEFDKLINELQEEGDILHDLYSLTEYCKQYPQTKMSTVLQGAGTDSYGCRIDSEKYAYLFRLNPIRYDYNVTIHCYVKAWLDKHIQNARKGIRFIDSAYKSKYRLKDGDMVRFIFADGEIVDNVARYIDEYHVEIGKVIYHICELAERTERSGAKIIPLRSTLPDTCYTYVLSDNCIGIIKKGESGYYKTDISFLGVDDALEITAEYNSKMGVSIAQEKAMQAGSMFGWDTLAADPTNYDACGNPIKNRV